MPVNIAAEAGRGKCRPGGGLPGVLEPGVEGVAQAVAEQVEAKHGEDDGQVGTGGASSDGEVGSTGGSDTAGSADGEGTGGEGEGGASALVPIACEGMAVPENGRITDFTELDAGLSWTSGQQDWGDSVSLTGGTFHYQGEDVDPITATIQEGGGVRLEVNIVAGGFVGFGLWFGPCTDASAFSGITFDMSGDIGNTELQVQMQMSRTYPIASDKGECVFTDEATQWDECINNYTIVEGVSEEVQTFDLTWDMFEGGQPVSPLDPSELLGIQLHFNCGEEGDCPLNVVLTNIMFLP